MAKPLRALDERTIQRLITGLEKAGLDESQLNFLLADAYDGMIDQCDNDESDRRFAAWVEVLSRWEQDAIVERELPRWRNALYPVAEQLARLQYFNETYWDHRWQQDDFAVESLSDPEPGQSARAATILHVEFDDPIETFDMWYRVYQGEALLQDELEGKDAASIREMLARLSATGRLRYAPGIHRVTMNLMAGKAVDHDRLFSDVLRDVNLFVGEFAQLEILSVFAVHDLLYSPLATPLGGFVAGDVRVTHSTMYNRDPSYMLLQVFPRGITFRSITPFYNPCVSVPVVLR